LSHLFLKESAGAAALAGIAVTIIGAAVISWGDVSADPGYFTGDMLALAGAFAAAAYLVCGRAARVKMALTPFLVLVYGFAALFLGGFCFFTGVRFFGYSGAQYALFAGLALLPTIGGHSFFLYALRYMKAFLVNLGFLGEPVGAAILAYLLFHEVPAWYFYCGGILIVAGTVFAIWRESTAEKPFA